MFPHRHGIYLALTGVSFFWGTSFAAAKIGMTHLSPLNLIIFRFIIVAILFSAMLLVTKGQNTIAKSDLPRFIIMGFLAITLFFYIQYTGLLYTSSINAALIVTVSPICTLILSSILSDREKIRPLNCAGIIAAFSGVTAIVTKGDFSQLFQSQSVVGDAMILCSAFIWSGFTVYSKSILTKYHPFVAIAYVNLFGSLLFLPLAFFPLDPAYPPFISQIRHIDAATIAAALYLAVFCSIYAYYIWYMGIEKLGAVRTAVFTYFNPLFAMLAGVLFMNEKLDIYTLTGSTLIIAGVFLANKKTA